MFLQFEYLTVLDQNQKLGFNGVALNCVVSLIRFTSTSFAYLVSSVSEISTFDTTFLSVSVSILILSK
jgi:hypothetical protein